MAEPPEPLKDFSCKELAFLEDGLSCIVDERTGIRSEAFIDFVEALRERVLAAEKAKGCTREIGEERY